MASATSLVRAAIVQIECHPAAYISLVMPLEEAFFVEGVSLANLGQRGFDVATLQQTCLERYTEWQAARLEAIMQFLRSLNPAPDLVVFPEYAVPWQCLERLRDSIAETDITILAGTHTLQSLPAAIQVYRSLGIEEKWIRRRTRTETPAVLPVVTSNTTRLIPKKSLSPYEQTDVTRLSEGSPRLVPILLENERSSLRMLPIICAEALQSHHVKGQYTLAAVVSYQEKPEHSVFSRGLRRRKKS